MFKSIFLSSLSVKFLIHLPLLSNMDKLSLRFYSIFILYITLNGFNFVSGFALGEMPSQTLGFGEVLQMPSPTLAPDIELVRRRLDWGFGMGKEIDQRGATNVCIEWTIPGGWFFFFFPIDYCLP